MQAGCHLGGAIGAGLPRDAHGLGDPRGGWAGRCKKHMRLSPQASKVCVERHWALTLGPQSAVRVGGGYPSECCRK